jgi:hypothetical protein
LVLRFIWKLICGNLEEQDSREEYDFAERDR